MWVLSFGTGFNKRFPYCDSVILTQGEQDLFILSLLLSPEQHLPDDTGMDNAVGNG